MMLQATFFIGLGINADGEKIPPAIVKILANAIRTYATDNMHGGTVILGTGFWSDNGKRLVEPVMTIVSTFHTHDRIREHAAKFADIATQTAVRVHVHEVYAVDFTPEGKPHVS
jgi:hypothetical protein